MEEAINFIEEQDLEMINNIHVPKNLFSNVNNVSLRSSYNSSKKGNESVVGMNE